MKSSTSAKANCVCGKCGHAFSRIRDLEKHKNMEKRKWPCPQCCSTFDYLPNLSRHKTHFHATSCTNTESDYTEHRESEHSDSMEQDMVQNSNQLQQRVSRIESNLEALLNEFSLLKIDVDLLKKSECFIKAEQSNDSISGKNKKKLQQLGGQIKKKRRNLRKISETRRNDNSIDDEPALPVNVDEVSLNSHAKLKDTTFSGAVSHPRQLKKREPVVAKKIKRSETTKQRVSPIRASSERIIQPLCEHRLIPNPPQWTKISLNRPITPLRIDTDKELMPAPCQCSPTDVNPCGRGSGCINYEFEIECRIDCPANDRCNNQWFTRLIRPRVELRYFGPKGWGLVTMEQIARSSFVIEYVGELINRDQFNERFTQLVGNAAQNFYFVSIDGLYIDATEYGNESRFVNHSCEPNCILIKRSVAGLTRIGLFAAIDIPIVCPSRLYNKNLISNFYLLHSTEHRANVQLQLGNDGHTNVHLWIEIVQWHIIVKSNTNTKPRIKRCNLFHIFRFSIRSRTEHPSQHN